MTNLKQNKNAKKKIYIENIIFLNNLLSIKKKGNNLIEETKDLCIGKFFFFLNLSLMTTFLY